MRIASLAELFAMKLADLKAAEEGVLQGLHEALEAAASPEVQAALNACSEQTGVQLQRLESIIRDYPDVDPSGGGAPPIRLPDGADQRVAPPHDRILQDLGSLALCQRIERHAMAAYFFARNYARRLGDERAAAVLTETIEEKAATDKFLSLVAERLLARLTQGARQPRDRSWSFPFPRQLHPAPSSAG